MPLGEFVLVRRKAEVRLEVFSFDEVVDRRGRLSSAVAARDFARDLAQPGCELALEIADAGFGGVIANRSQDRVVGDRDLLRRQAVVLEQFRDQMFLRNLQLLGLGVAGEPDHFHAVAQRRRHRVEDIRCADE